MTEREDAELRGDVKSCRLERDYVYPDHHWVMFTTDTYMRPGQLLEKKHVNPDGSKWSVACRYDEHGRLMEKESIADKPLFNDFFSYVYDSLGRLDRVVVRSNGDDGSSEERVHESRRYAADGTKTQTSYPRFAPNTGVATESMLHASTDAVAVMTVLAAADRPIRKVLYDADDRVIRRIGFKYDERGLLIEEGELVGGEILKDFRNIFRYDASGRLVDLDRRISSIANIRRTYTYNDHGDVVQEVVEQNAGMFVEGDLPVETWTERHSYQYDERGNWIERRSEITQSNGEMRLFMVQRRQLEYYDRADKSALG